VPQTRGVALGRRKAHPAGLLAEERADPLAAERKFTCSHSSKLTPEACRPDDHVLEVGFGHGRTLARVATFVPRGFVAGVDMSELMVRMARYRNRQCIEEGRVEVQRADSAQIPYPAECFDRVYAMHTLYFWHDPRVHLQEIHRVMKPGARFVLGFGPKEDERAVANFPAAIYRFYTSDEVQWLLEASGFTGIEMVRSQVASRDIVFGVVHRGAHEITRPLSKRSVRQSKVQEK